MVGFASQHDSIENYPGDTPLGASGRVFPEINWGRQGGLLLERSEEKSVWTAALLSSPRVVLRCHWTPAFLAFLCGLHASIFFRELPGSQHWPETAEAFPMGSVFSRNRQLLLASSDLITQANKDPLFILYTHPIRSFPLENSA